MPNSACASRRNVRSATSSRHDFSCDLGAASSLVDDELEPVLRNIAIGVEQISERVIGGIGIVPLDFSPINQYSDCFFAILANKTVGANRCFDSTTNFLRLLLHFFGVRTKAQIGETEKLVGTGENLIALLLHLRVGGR